MEVSLFGIVEHRFDKVSLAMKRPSSAEESTTLKESMAGLLLALNQSLWHIRQQLLLELGNRTMIITVCVVLLGMNFMDCGTFFSIENFSRSFTFFLNIS